MEIDKLRADIDLIDERIVTLLSERKKNVMQIGKIKKESKKPILVAEREAEIISRLKKKAVEIGADPELVECLFGMILKNSKRVQEK